MSHLTTTAGAPAGSQTLSGKQIATELTNEINKAFGDDKQFDLSNAVYGNIILKRYQNADGQCRRNKFYFGRS